MLPSLGRLRKFLFGISLEETSFIRRGFHQGEVKARQQLEQSGRAFVQGYHLALEVPKQGAQPRMRVGDQWLTWEEGKGFLFDDAWDHELVNENPNLRSVFIVDVTRPMGRLCRAVHSVMLFIMGQTYARWVLRRSAI